MNFGEILSWIFLIFLFFAYLMVLWTILGDLFIDHDTSGWVKAIWVVALIFCPFITALVYLIARGKGMQQRKLSQLQQLQAAQAEYIKQVAGSGGKSPADQISHAKELLDSGAISQEEFDQLKAKALA